MTEIADQNTAPQGRTLPQGHVPTVRRARGTRNRITRDIKQGLIESAVRHGFDGEGKDGLVGYFNYLLKNDLRAHANLIGHHQRLVVNVVSIPRRTSLTKEQAAQIITMDVADIKPASDVVKEAAPFIDAELVEASEDETAQTIAINDRDGNADANVAIEIKEVNAAKPEPADANVYLIKSKRRPAPEGPGTCRRRRPPSSPCMKPKTNRAVMGWRRQSQNQPRPIR